MLFTLKDYQADAVADTLARLRKAKKDWADGDRTAFTLAATTGAGKTVIAAAVIESLFYGNDDLDFEADPTATILWVTDDPSLNVQTWAKFIAASDLLPHFRLNIIGKSFQAERLDAGTVYFLNTQKMAKTSTLVKGHTEASDDVDAFPGMAMPDLRQFTIWDTIANTIRDDKRTLYLVLDEAHRGLGKRTKATEEERGTIVARLIGGHADVPAMPIVWGISATPDRFVAAMKGAHESTHTLRPAVQVDTKRVQASGLLKDDVALYFPDEKGKFDTVLLREAALATQASTKAWAAYEKEQPGEKVIPLLVVQVPNLADEALMASAVDTVLDAWPGLTMDAFAHVFGDHTGFKIGPNVIPYVEPQRVQDDTHIRVLFAKDAISTGWDCPRAEVIVSFRPAQDDTHIAQLLGRMVRTPLARRVPGDDVLNAVTCFLPEFNRDKAKAIAARLLGDDDADKGTDEGGRRVLLAPMTMTANKAIPQSVWDILTSMPSETLPRRAQRPVKRLTALAQALSDDGLLADAGKIAHAHLHKVLNSLGVLHAEQIAAALEDVDTLSGEVLHATPGSKVKDSTYEKFSTHTDDRALAADFADARRVLTPDLARTYVQAKSAGDDDGDEAIRDAQRMVAALARVEQVKTDLDKYADGKAKEWLDKYRVDIKGLPDARQAVYADIEAMSSEPQRTTIRQPRNRLEETQTVLDGQTEPVNLPVAEKHLLSDDEGNFPLGSLNGWERSALETELARKGVVAWYRNPSRPSYDALAVAYKDTAGVDRQMVPDLIFFTNHDGEIRVSIVDPHRTDYTDAIPKLQGLARFTALYGDEYHRIESLAKIGDQMRVLDMKKATVRDAVKAATDAETLFKGPAASNY